VCQCVNIKLYGLHQFAGTVKCTLQEKWQFYRVIVIPVLSCGCSCCSLTEQMRRRETAEMLFLVVGRRL